MTWLAQLVQSSESGSWIRAWVRGLLECCCANAGEVVTTLPCCHWYHTECIRATWQQTMTKHWHSYCTGVPLHGMCSNIFKHIQTISILRRFQKLKLLWVHRGMAAACEAVPLVQDGGGAWGIGNLTPAASKNRCVVRLAMLDHVDLRWNMLKGNFDGGKCLRSP